MKHLWSKASVADLHLIFFALAVLLWAFPHLSLYVVTAGLAIFGLQHGAFDLELIRKNQRSTQLFLFIYAFATLIFLAVAIESRPIAFALFLALSSYHFGAELLRTRESGLGSSCLSLMAGATVLLIVAARFFEVPVNSALDFCSTFALTMAVAVILITEWRKTRSVSRVTELAGLFAVLCALPPIVGFGLFFAYWHALDSFEEQRRELNLSWSTAFTKSAPLTIGALFVLVIGWLYSLEMTTILVAALAVSHILTRHLVGPVLHQAGVLYPSSRERAAAIQ